MRLPHGDRKKNANTIRSYRQRFTGVENLAIAVCNGARIEPVTFRIR
jgi:hypothetical protein